MRSRTAWMMAVALLLPPGCATQTATTQPNQTPQDTKPPPPPDPFLVPRGELGVVKVLSHARGRYHVFIIFPRYRQDIRDATPGGREWMLGPSVEFERPVVLFDQAGPLLTLPTTHHGFARFWCENDGGMHVRPDFPLFIPETLLPRPLTPDAALDNIAAFAVVETAPTSLLATDKQPRLSGDLDGDGTPEAMLLLEEEVAGCDGDLMTSHDIVLLTPDGEQGLRCCGP